MNEKATPKRNLCLDGLRGIAILGVTLLHHNLLNAGWIGVDLFFVLSGYLITSILRRTRDDLFFWSEFWVKRATRILPPFLMLICVAEFFTPHSSIHQMAGYTLTLGDILAYKRPRFEVLRPLWSLAVEEHFYLLWPFAVRILKRKTLMYILASIIIIEPALRAFGSLHYGGWEVFYFLTPYRLDGLSWGCLLALAIESENVRLKIRDYSAFALVGLIALFVALQALLGSEFSRSNPTAFYNAAIYSIVAGASVALISYVVSHPTGFVGRVLSWQPIVFLGTISYGVYLYQVAISSVVMRTLHLSHHQAFLVDLPIILLVSWLSFRFYEEPFILWGRKYTERCVKRAAYLSS